ncbi:hypothetical protein KP509_38G063800 [Ceratopteris richardii]|nr:hypothetical protein KP509_38G063800 [Ceratopteris richardii]
MDDALEGVAHASGVKMPRFGQTEDFGLEAAPLRKNRYSKEIGCGIGTPKTDDAQKVVLTMRRGRTSNNGPMGPSLLSRPLESSPLSNGHNIPRLSSASRMIPMSEGSRNNSSSGHAGGQSAPVEVPKWSKMMGRESKIGIMDDQDAKDDDNDRLPPHELLARENASRQHTTFSVCEGLGRTLKGRDLSRVRNAVWSQMGFAD